MRIDETKPGQPDDDELTVLARRLGRISLSTQPTERDHLMFQCGQAAAVAQASTPSSEKKLWLSIAACMLVAFGGGTLVGHNSSTTSGAAVTQKNLTTKQVESIQASDAPPIRAGQWNIYSDSSSTPKS